MFCFQSFAAVAVNRVSRRASCTNSVHNILLFVCYKLPHTLSHYYFVPKRTAICTGVVLLYTPCRSPKLSDLESVLSLYNLQLQVRAKRVLTISHNAKVHCGHTLHQQSKCIMCSIFKRCLKIEHT